MADDRIARFERRQAELKKLSDAELKDRFWRLCNQVVEPIVGMAKTHTSPSIERSVLLRMGIDSVSTHAVVARGPAAGGPRGQAGARLRSSRWPPSALSSPRPWPCTGAAPVSTRRRPSSSSPSPGPGMPGPRLGSSREATRYPVR